MGKMKVWVALALVVVVALVAVACGGTTTTTGATATTGAPTETTAAAPTETTAAAPAELTTVNVGVIPYSGMGVLWLGDQKGFFKDHGLKLVLVPAESPAAVLASVQSGQEEFGFSTTIPLIHAVAAGLDVVAVVPNDGTVSSTESSTAIIVPANSTIKSAADLAGKKVAVPALGSEIDLLVHAAAERAGVDPNSVQTVQVPFPTMWAAVKAGQVDAAGTTEPFMSQAIADGAKNISDAERDILGGYNVTAFVTTRKYAIANPQIVKAFREAMEESITYAKDHLDEVRTIIAKNTGLDPSATKTMSLGVDLNPKFNMDGLKAIGNFMVKYGFIKELPPMDQIVLPAS